VTHQKKKRDCLRSIQDTNALFCSLFFPRIFHDRRMKNNCCALTCPIFPPYSSFLNQMQLRPCQQEALDALRPHSMGLVSMCCGSGKTFTFSWGILQARARLTILVFPSLVLMRQYHRDYIDSLSDFEQFDLLQVCSDSATHFTTSPSEIQAFLSAPHTGRPRLLTVTYHSFATVASEVVASATNVDQVVFDEAHHLGGQHTYAVTLGNFEFHNLVARTSFWTATPRNNDRLTMYNHEDPGKSQCGPTVFTYTLKQAIDEGVCKPVLLTVMLCKDPLNNSADRERVVVDLVVRAILEQEEKGYSYINMLTYHRLVNPPPEDAAGVVDFTDFVLTFATLKVQEQIRVRLQQLQSTEYPESKLEPDTLVLEAMHSGMSDVDRERVLGEFDRKVHSRVRILASCDTLNEGVDCKWANQAVAFGPSGSVVKETQRTGRLSRKPEPDMPPANILLPVCIDMSEFDPGWSPQEKDTYLRQEIQKVGNFGVLLNVAAALEHQDDPDLFEQILDCAVTHPPTTTPATGATSSRPEIEPLVRPSSSRRPRAPFRVRTHSDLSILVGIGAVDFTRTVMQAALAIRVGCGRVDRDAVWRKNLVDAEIYMDRHGFRPKYGGQLATWIRNQLANSKSHRHAAPKRHIEWETHVAKYRQHYEPTDVRWRRNLEQVEEYMDRHGHRPPQNPKNTTATKKLAHWIATQVKNAKSPRKYSLKDKELFAKWEAHVVKYSQHYQTTDVMWRRCLGEAEAYMDTCGQRPSKTSKNIATAKLGAWIGSQLKNAKPPGNMALSDDALLCEWKVHVAKYSRYYESNEVAWRRSLGEVEAYIDRHGSRPANNAKAAATKQAATWIGTQLMNARPPYGHEFRESGRLVLWEDHVVKYSQHYEPGDVKWRRSLREVEAYMDICGQRPSKGSKNIATAKLGTWICCQLENAKPLGNRLGNRTLSDDALLCEWKTHVAKYSQHYEPGDVKWRKMLREVEAYVDVHGCRPSQKHAATKDMGSWISNQMNNAKFPHKNALRNDALFAEWEKHLVEYSHCYELTGPIWRRNLANVEAYMDVHGHRPSQKNAATKNMGGWISSQLKNAKSHKNALQDDALFAEWGKHLVRYSHHYETRKAKWLRTLGELELYMDTHGRRPTKRATDALSKRLWNWFKNHNYNSKPPRKRILKDDTIFAAWENHRLAYDQYYYQETGHTFRPAVDEPLQCAPLSPTESQAARLARCCIGYTDWVKSHHMLHPRRDAQGQERTLANWAHALRIKKEREGLPLASVKCMEQVEGWLWGAHLQPVLSAVPHLTTSAPAPPPPVNPHASSLLQPALVPPLPTPAAVRKKRTLGRVDIPSAMDAGNAHRARKKQKLLLAAERITYLLNTPTPTVAESKELDAMMDDEDERHKGQTSVVDTYNDQGECSVEHTRWKEDMNQVFLTLLQRFHNPLCGPQPLHLVYLDGKQLGTTHALRKWVQPCSPVLHVANDSSATADAIKASGLVDYVSHSSINDALDNEWKTVPFSGAYIDLCTGTVQTLLATLKRLFNSDRKIVCPFVLGYTLTARDPHGQAMDLRVLSMRKWLHSLSGYSVREAEMILQMEPSQWSHQGTRTRFVVIEVH
jgi:superfamily II DNA or RNA helicase